jgi:metal-responsive CopG/Arc/MetJ family transcriptional regulator
MAKVQISINDDLLERLDNFADENYTSRSGLIATALTEYLNSREVLMLVKNLSLAVGKVAETGNVDEETMKKLEDFDRATKIMFGK